jgi:NADH-quinone oxidoreductase subunit I
MSAIVSAVNALATTIRQVVRPRTTVNYPWETRPRPERQRQTLALLKDEQGDELCIGCRMCENICPSRVIKVTPASKRDSPVTGKKRAYADDFTLNLQACIFCELCVQVCPEDALTMCRGQEQPGFCREDLVLTRDKLYANGKDLEHSWGSGSRLAEMHDPKRGVPPPPPKTDTEEKP